MILTINKLLIIILVVFLSVFYYCTAQFGDVKKTLILVDFFGYKMIKLSFKSLTIKI
jgi:hypothetical protein